MAELERAWPGGVVLVTQNIDDLHERGGSTAPLHMHGELLKSRCQSCGDIAHCVSDLACESVCPACGNPGGLRPHVVWFGEMPLHMDEIDDALAQAGLFISIGTSGNVYPAAGFVEAVRHHGHGHTVELNLEPSAAATAFAEAIYGPASRIVPAFVARLLA